ncbi:MAG: tetratricopeptide repeat protein [Candidatus Cloacimonetes bacterium]|nr:tetratricopeptide repeat protein [Candidatus Cloacimonadota bacterium]
MKFFFHFFSFISMVLVTMLFSSCAYYNTFYNAKQYFESAQSRPLNPQGRPTSQAIEDYNRVLRKCGVILTDFKNSRWVDDALFLMAKALYYRGQNLIQALDSFNDLIQFYPDSPFVRDAILYTAKIHYDLNQKDEAFSILRSFIANNDYQADHPKALVLISDLYIMEKNFIEAQQFLMMLIERFPRSPQFAEAYILLGKTYFDNDNFPQSLEIFYEITTKKLPRSIQYDAMYYIAYSYFYLNDFESAFNTIRNLQRREFRLAKLAEQSILHARIIAEIGNPADAIDMLELVTTNNQRTDIAAEAIYYIAEIQFRKLHDYENAIENFNRVRRESQRSEFSDRAVTRSAVASQILQYHRQSTTWTAEQLIAEQFKLAEFYLYELALPDSALYIYSLIPTQKINIEMLLDSLRTVITEYELDNFTSINHNIESLFAEADSIQVDREFFEEIAEIKSDIDIDNIKDSIALYENDLNMYDTLFIPQSYFMRIVVKKQFFEGIKDFQHLLYTLNFDFAESRYTEAAREFINDEPVTYLTRLEKYQLNRFEYAMSYYLQGPEIYRANLNYIINILESLVNTEMSDLQDKVLFTLGFIHFVDRRDFMTAQIYIDALLENAPQSDFANFVNNFYDGTTFIAYDRLPSIVEYDLLMAESMGDIDDFSLITAGPIERPLENLEFDEVGFIPPAIVSLPFIIPTFTPTEVDIVNIDDDPMHNNVSILSPILNPLVISNEEPEEIINENDIDLEEQREIVTTPLVTQTTPDINEIEETLSEVIETEITAPTPIITQSNNIPTEISQDHPVNIKYELVNQWTVHQGDSLWRIASQPEVFGNPLLWEDIFNANRDLILDPHFIYPNQIFIIPRLDDLTVVSPE